PFNEAITRKKVVQVSTMRLHQKVGRLSSELSHRHVLLQENTIFVPGLNPLKHRYLLHNRGPSLFHPRYFVVLLTYGIILQQAFDLSSPSPHPCHKPLLNLAYTHKPSLLERENCLDQLLFLTNQSPLHRSDSIENSEPDSIGQEENRTRQVFSAARDLP